MPKIPPPPPPVKKKEKQKFLVVQAKDSTDIKEFIDSLRTAQHASRHGGGTYSAFLPLADGRKLQVDIALSWEQS